MTSRVHVASARRVRNAATPSSFGRRAADADAAAEVAQQMTDLLGSRPCLGEFTAESAEKFAEMGRLVDGYAAEASALTLGATAVERVLRLQEAKCEAGSVRNDPTRSTAHPMRQVPVISPICWPCWSHIHMLVHRCARTCSCTR